MAHQVFLSYATEDAGSARLLCRVLEAEEGIRCWIAPRDVPAGTDYAAAILDAIKRSQLVLLVFSSHADTSPYVLREIERAVAYERPIVAIRVDGATPSSSLEYYLNVRQWLDAPRGIMSKHTEIVAAVRGQLQSSPANAQTAVPSPPAPRGGQEPSEGKGRSTFACPACGSVQPGTAKFCAECATPLAAAASSKLSTGLEACPPEGERKLVTVLVIGISAAESDPEALRDLLTACSQRLVVPLVERYGGAVERIRGDEVMALFGRSRTHENDPERALRSAIEIREALASFNKGRQVPAELRFGVDTGLLYAGGVGAGEPRECGVMGQAVTVAARLAAQANPGVILAGRATYRQVEGLFEWSEEGTDEPPTAHQLLGIGGGGSVSGACLPRSLGSPLVGRAEELSTLADCLAKVRGGEGGVVLLIGEAGLGKSRLLAEARVNSEDQDLVWLEGHTLSFGRAVGYWPILEIIQRDTAIDGDDAEAERWAKLASRVGALLGAERNEVLPYMAALLGIPLPDELAERVRPLDAEAVGRRLHRALRLYFTRLAEERPTVVVFDDVHLLDGSSASLLEHLLPIAREVPLLFCLASRPESESPLARLRELLHAEFADLLTEIALRPLSREESALLISNLARLDDLPTHLMDAIYARAEGNPFFVEEVVRSLLDVGGIVRDESSGRYRVTEKVTRITLPDTLQGVIMARVDRLEEDLRQVLRVASVIGRTFWYRVLAAVVGPNRDLDQCLAALEAGEFIRERARDPEFEYVFQHALVQEAAYESVLIRRRMEIHCQVAATIERLFPDRLEEFCGRLAYHYTQAEEWGKAREYLLKAADQSLSIAANSEAITYLEKALEAQSALSRSRPDLASKIDPLDRAALWRKVAALRVRQRHAVEGLAAIREAEAELDRAREDTGKWWAEWIDFALEKALVLYLARDEAALFALLETLEPAVQRWGTAAQESRVLFTIAFGRVTRERWRPSSETLDYIRAACEVTANDERLMFYGFCLLWMDQLDDAESVLSRALATATEAADAVLETNILTYLACVERRRGNVARTAALADRCLAAAREGESLLYQGVALANIAWVHSSEGDLVAAEREARDSLKYLSGPGVYPFTWLARWPLIAILLERGDIAEAIEHAAAMLEPTQQELPAVLAQALSDSVGAWKDGHTGVARDALAASRRVAESLRYA